MEIQVNNNLSTTWGRSHQVENDNLAKGRSLRRSLRRGKVRPWFLLLLGFFLLPAFASAGTLRKPPSNLGLVAYWPMNEGVGTQIGDASGNGHTGTLGGTPLPTWVSGKLGKALSFTGSGEGLNKVTFSPIALSSSAYTVSMWVYLTADCTLYGSLFSENSIQGLFCYRDGTGNKIVFYTLDATNYFNNTPLSLNRWYHFVEVNSGGMHRFYLNGVEDGTFIWGPGTYADSIGNDNAEEVFNGKIDEVRVYSRSLSATEIAYLYRTGTAKITGGKNLPSALAQGQTGYWTFDGPDMVNNVADKSVYNRKGTLVNYTSTTTSPGKVGQALKFNGTNNYVSTSVDITNFLSTATGTISVWMRPTGTAANNPSAVTLYTGQTAVSCSCTASFGISRSNRTDLGQDRIWVWGYSSEGASVTYNVNEWIHITMVHANGVLSVYKNGDFVSSVNKGDFVNFSGTFSIGNGWNGTSKKWLGDLDEVRTWNRELSASEIKQVYSLSLGTVTNKTPVTTLTTGLAGYWTFDGKDTNWSTNTVTDRSGNGNTGTLTNMSTTTSPVPGKIGQALTFVASNSQYVNLGTSSTLKPGTGLFSVSFWYRGLRGSGESFIASGTAIFANYWRIRNDSTQFCAGNSCDKSVSASYTLPNNNEWHHIVAVLDRTPNPDTLTMYIDGVSQGVATGTLDGESSTNSSNTVIGGTDWAAPVYRQGPMDEVRIYNRTLSANEVLKLYRMGK